MSLLETSLQVFNCSNWKPLQKTRPWQKKLVRRVHLVQFLEVVARCHAMSASGRAYSYD